MKAISVALTFLLVAAVAEAQVTPSLRLSNDESHLIGPDGQPVFVNGDTAWSLMVEPTDSEVVMFLDDRQAKGYNAVIAELIEHLYSSQAPANVNGVVPFTGAAFATPNEAYFARIDEIINLAAQRGITIFLAPIYLGFDCGNEGWCADAQAASTSTMRDYGRFLGERYRDFPNIVWMMGGDTNPFAHNVQGKIEALVAGIKEFDTLHLMTAHNGPEESSQDIWGTPDWLDINGIYTYSATYIETESEYKRPNALPAFLLESLYENEYLSTPTSLRRQAYQSVLWGARLGHFFGNCPIWPFSAPSAAGFCAGTDWKDELDSPGSTTVAYVGDLMGSRRHWLMEPDHAGAALIAGAGSGDFRAVASRASDGSSIIVYVPTRREVTVDLGQVAGSEAQIWWWNPRTNQASALGEFQATGPESFTPPDDNDWVLVVDSAEAGFAPPGGVVAPVRTPMPPTNLIAQ